MIYCSWKLFCFIFLNLFFLFPFFLYLPISLLTTKNRNKEKKIENRKQITHFKLHTSMYSQCSILGNFFFSFSFYFFRKFIIFGINGFLLICWKKGNIKCSFNTFQVCYDNCNTWKSSTSDIQTWLSGACLLNIPWFI